MVAGPAEYPLWHPCRQYKKGIRTSEASGQSPHAATCVVLPQGTTGDRGEVSRPGNTGKITA
jgi:hypothetical protein